MSRSRMIPHVDLSQAHQVSIKSVALSPFLHSVTFWPVKQSLRCIHWLRYSIHRPYRIYSAAAYQNYIGTPRRCKSPNDGDGLGHMSSVSDTESDGSHSSAFSSILVVKAQPDGSLAEENHSVDRRQKAPYSATFPWSFSIFMEGAVGVCDSSR